MYAGFEDTTTYIGLYALGQYSNSDTTRCRLGVRLNKANGEIAARVDYQGGTLYPVFYTTEKKPTYRDVGAPSTSGTDASGTWNININGNAATATKAAQDYDGYNITTTYLKCAGGTMTGDISFATIATWPTESGETYPIVSKGLYWNGSSDFAKLFYRVAGSDKGELVMQMGDAIDEVVVIENNNGTNYARIGSHGITLNYGTTDGTLVTIGANKITTYGNACLTGSMKSGYYGLHFGDDNTYMTAMSGPIHQGLYNNANSNWIIYYNRENGRIGLGTSNLEGYTVTVGGSLKATNLYGTLYGNASSATTLTSVLPVTLGGTGANNKKNAWANLIPYYDQPWSDVSQDTGNNWASLGNLTVSWWPSGNNGIYGKPSDWGLVLTVCASPSGSSEMHQLWFSQANGAIYHRGGNGSTATSMQANGWAKLWQVGDAVTGAVWN